MADFKILVTVVLTIIKISDAGVHSISSSGVLGMKPDSTGLLTNIEYTTASSSSKPLPKSVSSSASFFTSVNSKNAIPTSAPNPVDELPLPLPLTISISIQSPYSKSNALPLPSSVHTSPFTSPTLSNTTVSTPSTSTTSKLLPLFDSNSTTSPEYSSRNLSSSTVVTSVKTPTTTPSPLLTPKLNLTPDQSTVYNLSDILKLLPAGFTFPTLSSSVLSSNSFSSPRPTTIPESTSYLITGDYLNSALLNILSKLSEVSDLE